MRRAVEARGPAMEQSLERWVNQNTGSFNGPGLRELAALLERELADLGFAVRVEPGGAVELPGRGTFETGPLVLARSSAAQRTPAPPRFLLAGHYDTVFEPDSPFQRFARGEPGGDRATGPGVADMKGGLVVLLETLRALRASGDLARADWTVLLNGDEEIGSLASRARIEAAARTADFGFVFESSRRGGGMVSSRSGLGQFHIAVEGVAAHAGSAHERGRSAIRELAHKILAIEALTDYARGVTLNVGTVSGGSKRNIVPERAEAWIDLRYDEPAQGEAVRAALERIAAQPVVEGTRTTLWGALHRPPKLLTPAVQGLLDRQAEAARALGFPTARALHSGGGTDGSLMGGVGLATLDSLGAVGGSAHTDREWVSLASLRNSSAAAAVLLRRLIRKPLSARSEPEASVVGRGLSARSEPQASAVGRPLYAAGGEG